MSSSHPLPPYIDVVLVVLAAPLLFLVGVPALGYAIGAASWLAFRAVGIAVDRHARTNANVLVQVSLRVQYRLVRVLALVAAAVIAAKAGRADGLTALLVITFAFSAQLILLLCDGRHRTEGRHAPSLRRLRPEAIPGPGQAPREFHPPA